MKTFLVFLTVAVVAVSCQTPRPKPAIPIENIDIDNILRNEKLVRRYLDCALGKGRCDSNGREVKENLPRVLRQNCRECTPRQREFINKIRDFMRRKYPRDWAIINAKYSG